MKSRRILLFTILVASYWTFFFGVPLIETLQLYAEGDEIYNFVTSENNQTNAAVKNDRVPRIMHRMWANDEFLKQGDLPMTRSFNMCNDLYQKRGWKTLLWTDDSIRMWLKKHFSDFIELFDAYPFKIQKIDAARYFILYHFGGVYMDLDIGCFSTKDIGDIVSYMEASEKHVALPLTSPVGLSNDVMIAIKNSLFFKKAILSLQSKNRWFGAHYLTVLYSTGSMFLSLLYFQQNPPERSVVAIIPPRLYSEKGTRYFQHFRGSTWHGKDALFIQWIVRYWCAIVPFFIAFMLLRRITCIRSNTKENKLKQ